MVEFHNVATFDAVWLSRWRRAKVRAYIRESARLHQGKCTVAANGCEVRGDALYHVHTV